MTFDIINFISFSQTIDARGTLTVAESGRHVPFDIKRLYYISNGNVNHPRGGHAHKKTKNILIPIVGKTTLILDNGKDRQEIRLMDPSKGLFVDAGVFIQNIRVEPNAVCLVLASALYDEADYIRDYSEFLKTL